MTTGIAEPSAAAPVTDPPAKNSFQRIVGVLFAPAETFRDIARKPDILVPLLLIVIVTYVTVALTAPRMDWDAVVAQQEEAMRKQNPNMTDADMERVAKFTKAGGTVFAYTMPLFFIAWYAIVAGVLLLAVRLFGGEGTYKQAFSATLYAWMPMLLAGIVGTVVVLVRGGLIDPQAMQTLVKSNPAFLVDIKEQPILFSLLSSLDIFTIWYLILLVIGFAALSRLSKTKVAVIVISLWLVTVVIKVGMAALGAARMKA
jgi:hypothetical protein